MGQILLVRHGQASWGAVDYDVLSPAGEEQAAVVGRALSGVSPTAVLHGTMKRQQRTAEIAAAAAGWRPEPTVDGRWDEMDHAAVLSLQPKPFEGEPDPRQFQAWFEAATDRWTAGANDHEYDESFPGFRRRVLAALDDLLTDLGRDGTAVVVTSGGPVAVVATRLLDAGTTTYQRLARVVANTGITRLVSGRSGLSLVSFNEHAHLQGRPDLLTYR